MSALNKKMMDFYKNIAEKFASNEKMRTFAIPKQKKRWW